MTKHGHLPKSLDTFQGSVVCLRSETHNTLVNDHVGLCDAVEKLTDFYHAYCASIGEMFSRALGRKADSIQTIHITPAAPPATMAANPSPTVRP